MVEGHCGRQVSVRDISSIEEEADGEEEEEEEEEETEEKYLGDN